MNRLSPFAAGLLLGLAAAGSSLADDSVATPAEAEQRLKAIVGLVKTKGVPGAAEQMMAADDPVKCRYKDVSCLLIATADGTFVANTAVPKLVGSKMPMDTVDIDGVPVIAQQINPAKEGKTKWEAKFKFARPGTKKIVPRLSLCEKADAAHVACVVVSQV